MNRRVICAMCAAVLIVAGGVQSARAVTWDAYTDWNITGVQTSTDVWQYLFMQGQPGTNGPYTAMGHFVDVVGTNYRYLAWDEDGTYSHYFFKMLGVPPTPDVPDILSDFGASYTNVLAWRSPIDGVVDLSFIVRKQTNGGTGGNYALFQDSDATPLVTGSITGELDNTSGPVTFTNVPVSVGTTFYLHTSPGTQINSDQMGVTFTVTEVPEPGTLAVLSSFLAVLVGYGLRRRM
jgi:hypothetical protein